MAHGIILPTRRPIHFVAQGTNIHTGKSACGRPAISLEDATFLVDMVECKQCLKKLNN